MNAGWSDLRFLFARALGLARRALVSLRQRGGLETLSHIRGYLRRARMEPASSLYFPHVEPFRPFALPSHPLPRASIVVPVYNQFAYTLACLRAMAAYPCLASYEVIVVDDGSSDETKDCLPRIDGVRYHRRAHNGGFVAACNDGALLARGEVLVFLNNDTIPQQGWLDGLLETFETHADTGLAVAKLIYPDGRLQEAGGLVFSDASGWNYGRFGAPDDPRYSYVRECDYGSGAAIAIPRTLFNDVGGFDARYSPAYYEDTDLAFAIRALGKTVRFQPASLVVHCEGATSGTDITQGAKAYQVRNSEVFGLKWREALAAQPAPGSDVDRVATRARQTVLVIDALTPDATRDSGSLRLLNLMRLLLDEGIHVVFIAANRQHAGAATRALQAIGVECWYAPFAERAPAFLRKHGRRFDAVITCRHYVMREFLPLLRRHAPRARLIFDTVDLHYLRELRGAEISREPAAARGAAVTKALELDVIARSDITWVVSETERSLLALDAPNARVEVVSNVHDVHGSGNAFEQRQDIVFVGGFRHPPNADAVIWFVEHVLPLLHSRRPEIVFHCIGADANSGIRELSQIPGVVIHGHVADLVPWMERARLAVAPLRYGAGVKGKVNLSMAHGQPVVATSCAVEGMHLTDGVDVLVADSPQAFSDAILRAYGDADLWQRLSANGLANVRQHFSADAALAAVRRSLPASPSRPPRMLHAGQ